MADICTLREIRNKITYAKDTINIACESLAEIAGIFEDNVAVSTSLDLIAKTLRSAAIMNEEAIAEIAGLETATTLDVAKSLTPKEKFPSESAQHILDTGPKKNYATIRELREGKLICNNSDISIIKDSSETENNT